MSELPPSDEAESQTIDPKGPTSYRYWRAKIPGRPCVQTLEFPLYSDVALAGAVNEGLGPYQIINARPAHVSDPTLILRADVYPTSDAPSVSIPSRPKFVGREKPRTDDYTGVWAADEMAALLSLLTGNRLRSGACTRQKDPDADWLVLGDSNRPLVLPGPPVPLLPRARVVGNAAHDREQFATFAKLKPDQATKLIRAARSYRDALWIVEGQPELAWLLLVSALEVGAIEHATGDADRVETLRLGMPKLASDLEAFPGAVEIAAKHLARHLKATKRFVDFVVHFMPDPPELRPAPVYCFAWTKDCMRDCAKRIYELRSDALHEGIPFPRPMCQPDFLRGQKVPAEIFIRDSAVLGGVWLKEHLPCTIHMFEHVVRGCLVGWWRAMTSTEEPPPK